MNNIGDRYHNLINIKFKNQVLTPRIIVDRSYWENLGTKKTITMVDNLLEIAKEFNPSLELKYNKFYIGLSTNGQPCNFFIVRPKKDFIRFEVRLKKSDETQERLENAGLDLMGYDNHWGYYRIRLKPGEIEKNKEILTEIIKEAYEAANIE